MRVEKLAFEVGRSIARLEKRALSDQYIAEATSHESPILNRIIQHAGIGAIGAGVGFGTHAALQRDATVAKVIAAALKGAHKGGWAGTGTGVLHGSFDAGLTRGVHDTKEPSTLRSGLASGLVLPFSGVPGVRPLPAGLLGALAAEVGERHGVSARHRFGG